MNTTTQYTLFNTGSINLNWQATETSDWITLSSYSGVIASYSSSYVTLIINTTEAIKLPPGNYSASIQFNNTTTGQGSTTRVIKLNVLEAPISGAAVLSVSPIAPFVFTVTKTKPYIVP